MSNTATQDRAIQTVLDTAPGRRGATWRLIHRTAGLRLAGAGMVPVGEAWGAIATLADGTITGTWHKLEADARAYFTRFTTPIVEQRA